jgi:hypothetical protein
VLGIDDPILAILLIAFFAITGGRIISGIIEDLRR